MAGEEWVAVRGGERNFHRPSDDGWLGRTLFSRFMGAGWENQGAREQGNGKAGNKGTRERKDRDQGTEGPRDQGTEGAAVGAFLVCSSIVGSNIMGSLCA